MNARAPKGTADMLPDVARAWEHLHAHRPGALRALRLRADLHAALRAHRGLHARHRRGDRHRLQGDVHVRGQGRPLAHAASRGHRERRSRGARAQPRPPTARSAKLYYAGPMFRYERPQKGRMRQFWQIGAELLGAAEPTRRRRAHHAARGASSRRAAFRPPTCGCCSTRWATRTAARRIATRSRRTSATHADELCDECNRRADTNPLRAFDCKNPGCRDGHGRRAAAARRAVRRVRGALRGGQGAPRRARHPVRRGPVARARARLLHAHRLRGAGRRGSRLAERHRRRRALRPPHAGVRRSGRRRASASRSVSSARCSRWRPPARACRAPPRAEVYVARVDDGVRGAACSLLAQRCATRESPPRLDHQGRSLKSQFKQADRLGARFVVVVGPDELAAGEVTLRDMGTKEETPVVSRSADRRPVAAA